MKRSLVTQIRSDWTLPQKPLKEPAKFWKKKISRHIKPRLTCIIKLRKQKYGGGEKQLMIRSIAHHLSNMAEAEAWTRMAAGGAAG